MLMFLVNSSIIAAESIKLKYFESGHTFMSADSVHHSIENQMKRKGSLFDFNNFVDSCEEAGCKTKKIDGIKNDIKKLFTMHQVFNAHEFLKFTFCLHANAFFKLF